MKKQLRKLIAIFIMLVMSLSLVTVTSYAWLVLSESPAVEGISLVIGGSDTIKLASDITEVSENGEILHYPGNFLEILKLEDNEYIPLSPVSTADGINWFFPKNIKNGIAGYAPGVIEQKEVSLVNEEFIHDNSLEYANITANEDSSVKGSYRYYDFWVISPGSDTELRISAGEDGDGSYVINLPTAVKSADGYSLTFSNIEPSTYARVGFLVNTDTQTNSSMSKYVTQLQYRDEVKKLKGIYPEKGQSAEEYKNESTYIVYEPNADKHISEKGSDIYTYTGIRNFGVVDGDYVFTYPISKTFGNYVVTDMQDTVIVQKNSDWVMSNNNEAYLQQQFKAYLIYLGDSVKDYNEKEIVDQFYNNWLQKNCAHYLSIGRFVKNNQQLYSMAEGDKRNYRYVKEEKMDQLQYAGATDDAVIVYLEKNVPQRIRMYVYLEGQDVDCISNSAVNDLVVHLELAGSN